jgi:DNA polymerase-3 subunit epsilon
MLSRFLSLDYLRKRALVKAEPGILHDYLSTPLSAKTSQCEQVTIVSLDLETTGLDPIKDKILSFGLVELEHMTIKLETSRHQLITTNEEIPEESAVIHQITDDQAATGVSINDALQELLQRLAGKVMLVHYSAIEQRFINAACERLFGAPFVIPIIDTLVLAQRIFERRNHTIQPGDLRLFNLRPRYNLPNYKAHNALSDAVATAELFLAMASEMVPQPNHCQLKRFLTR